MNFAFLQSMITWVTGRTVVLAGWTWVMFVGAWLCWAASAYLYDGWRGALLLIGAGLFASAYQLAKPYVAKPATAPAKTP